MYVRRFTAALLLGTGGLLAIGACTITVGPPLPPGAPPAPAPVAPTPPGPAAVAPAATPEAVGKASAALGKPPKPAKPATRRSTGVVLSPKKRNAPLVVAPFLLQAAKVRTKKYEDAEAKAPPALQTQVRELRTALGKSRATFQVGVTGVALRPLKAITGGVVERPDPNAIAQARAARARSPKRANLIQRSMLWRAKPPPGVRQTRPSPSDPDDRPTQVGAGPTGERGAGATTSQFPSSQFPSPSASSFSWRDRMTPIKDQGSCGSCWAFASTAVLEANEILINGRSLDLAEQQLVNCAPNPFTETGGDNCNGNAASSVWKWLSGNYDAVETAAPYRGKMASCNAGLGKDYKVQDWDWASDNWSNPSVDELKAAIVAHGPLAASVRATRAFQHYTGGVFDERDSGSTNHIIVLAGWDDSKGAWHLRNSWGADWGEDGYMWIKYGSNSVGAWATWSEPVHADPPPPPTFADRYVSVKNDTGEALKVFVDAEVMNGTVFSWVPALPSANAATFKYDVPAGVTLDLKRTDNNTYLRARKLRIWATSVDGKRQWVTNKTADYVVAAAPYQATERERVAVRFQQAAPAASNPDQLYQAGHSARERGDWAGAERSFQAFADQYSSDGRVHEVRFWVGAAQYLQGKLSDATMGEYHMINGAPRGHAYIPFAFYYLGASLEAQGYCGYATRNLEVVAYGDVNAPDDWKQYAKDEINAMMQDDGTICANWD